ncbi:MAG: hypothetical protein LBC81_01955 [Tannerellaceae bacterium]|jgi:hypothetical protein|nr:hypothetical protein [Tannerellaceae bacterium]
MKKNIFLIIGIVLAVVACSKQSDKTEPEPTGLTGTKWKLQGILDTQTDVLQILEPTDCEKCYTLEFITDYTAGASSIINGVYIDFREEGVGLIEKIEEIPNDGNTFRITLAWHKAYILSNDELRIICDVEKQQEEKHVIFKLIES